MLENENSVSGEEKQKVVPNQEKSQCIIYFPRAQKLLDLRNTESKDLDLTKQIWELIKDHKNMIDIYAVQKFTALLK